MQKKMWKIFAAMMFIIAINVIPSSAAVNGEITSIQIEPDYLISGQSVYQTILVENIGSESGAFQLEIYRYDDLIKKTEFNLDAGGTKTVLFQGTMGSPGERVYKYELYWDLTWPTSDVLLDSVTEERRCFSAQEVSDDDHDNLKYYYEQENMGTDPYNADTDGDNKRDDVDERPTISEGSIFIKSEPSDADVYFEGTYKGTTPKSISDIQIGSYKLELRKSGYESKTLYDVTINAGDVKNIQESLEPLIGSIFISSNPSGANIYLNDVPMGITPKTIPNVQIGSYKLELRKSGYESKTLYGVTINTGDVKNIQESLELLTGSIFISSNPSGANIYLDDVPKGITPKTISDVPIGPHIIRLEIKDYNKLSESISVEAKKTIKVDRQLTLSDTTKPTICLKRSDIMEQNNNEILEKGESLKIIYGAKDDDSEIVSITLLLDGKILEFQNEAGTYTAETTPLTVGKHVIKVEAIDSKSNTDSRELPIIVKQNGPSVYFATTKTTIKKDEDAIFTLSTVNPIGNNPFTAQLILKPPSGVSVISSSFAKSASGIYTCTQVIEPGDGVRSIEIRLTGNQVGTHEIKSEIHYQSSESSSDSMPSQYDSLKLIVEPDTIPLTSGSTNEISKMPGFCAVATIIGLLIVYLKKR